MSSEYIMNTKIFDFKTLLKNFWGEDQLELSEGEESEGKEIEAAQNLTQEEKQMLSDSLKRQDELAKRIFTTKTTKKELKVQNVEVKHKQETQQNSKEEQENELDRM